MRLVPVARAGVPARERRVAHGERLGRVAELVEPLGQAQDAIDISGEHVARGAALGDRLVVLDGAVTVQDGGQGAAGLSGAPAARRGLPRTSTLAPASCAAIAAEAPAPP